MLDLGADFIQLSTISLACNEEIEGSNGYFVKKRTRLKGQVCVRNCGLMRTRLIKNSYVITYSRTSIYNRVLGTRQLLVLYRGRRKLIRIHVQENGQAKRWRYTEGRNKEGLLIISTSGGLIFSELFQNSGICRNRVLYNSTNSLNWPRYEELEQ